MHMADPDSDEEKDPKHQKVGGGERLGMGATIFDAVPTSYGRPQPFALPEGCGSSSGSAPPLVERGSRSAGVMMGLLLDGIGDLKIAPELEQHRVIACALEKALETKPRKKDGNASAADAEALSRIIGCMEQKGRGRLVEGLLRCGFDSWPPAGCVFDLRVKPPLLAAIEAFETFDKVEWQATFEALVECGDMDREWGPDLDTGHEMYYNKFGKNF